MDASQLPESKVQCLLVPGLELDAKRSSVQSNFGKLLLINYLGSRGEYYKFITVNNYPKRMGL